MGILPRPERDAAMRQVVILLDRRIQRADRRGQPARREAREVVAEQVGRRGAGCEQANSEKESSEEAHGTSLDGKLSLSPGTNRKFFAAGTKTYITAFREPTDDGRPKRDPGTP